MVRRFLILVISGPFHPTRNERDIEEATLATSFPGPWPSWEKKIIAYSTGFLIWNMEGNRLFFCAIEDLRLALRRSVSVRAFWLGLWVLLVPFVQDFNDVPGNGFTRPEDVPRRQVILVHVGIGGIGVVSNICDIAFLCPKRCIQPAEE